MYAACLFKLNRSVSPWILRLRASWMEALILCWVILARRVSRESRSSRWAVRRLLLGSWVVVRVGKIDVEDGRRLLPLIRGEGEIPVEGEVVISKGRRFIELVIGAAFRRPPLGGG